MQRQLVSIQDILHEVMQDKDSFYEVTRKYNGVFYSIHAGLRTNFTFFEKVKMRFCELLNIGYTPIYTYYSTCPHGIADESKVSDSILSEFLSASGVLKQLQEYINRNIKDLPELEVHGELCAPELRGNHHGLTHGVFYVTNIFDIAKQEYLLPIARWDLYDEIFGAEPNSKYVKQAVVEYVTSIHGRSLESILAMSDYTLSSGKPNEGLVWKAMDRDFSFKVISNNFLLMED